MTPSQLIAFLNAARLGELEALRLKIDEARAACRKMEQPELADMLAEAGTALGQADLKTYRRRVETVVARLGHLR